ncbi:hypothetical protein AMK59_7434, partial [Oryctes borbonicus]
DPYYDLLSTFLEDLRSTHWFENNLFKAEIRDQAHYNAYDYLYKSTIVTFMSTHTGMTRWQYLTNDEDIIKNFEWTNSRSVDELWYKRTVEENYEFPNATYIFSIPLIDEMDIDNNVFNESQMVTVTHTIFKKEFLENEHHIEKSPAATVGYQM